ncbi:BRCT domain-containing protein [Brevundimonas nasdae]|uniref:BRCT domain-containing protein n=1 Tax=Brevundimonas nasdae TaxID=172043 RepID=A0ACD4VKH4_9CAUL|nr:BRCT domain-containing protein [Brevundimonas nasdae]WOB78528.1 BRCT domain-containing protein [Brevundimonas nasdae]
MDSVINKLSSDRITARQIDELVGLARGIAADGDLNQAEVKFLQKWLAANTVVSDQPVIRTLYARINEVLADGVLDDDEKVMLLETLNNFSSRDFELGEVLKSSTLPLCDPAPALQFSGRTYCFTGTFMFGQRKHCESAVLERGGQAGGLNRKTQVLVVGAYATESWKHSSFGNKILQASAWRDEGSPISIVSEAHWTAHL